MSNALANPDTSGPVHQFYRQELQTRGYSSDPAQLRAIAALERCATDWAAYRSQRSNRLKKWLNHPDIPRGVYMHGGVGRGKSFLMDCFFQAVPIRRKTRLHFHEFMREVHRELAVLQGTPDPLDVLGARMAQRFKLICFDEFHVSDITDAMILHRLLDALFRNGVGLVTTSNFRPDDLYPNGLHRDRLLPAIALLNARLEVLDVDNGTDYRSTALQQVPSYLHPLDAATQATMEATYTRLAEIGDESPEVSLGSRSVRALRRAGGVVWFDFRELCGKPHGQNDYLELAGRFHTVLLGGVPEMDDTLSVPARRLTLLVDVLYDRRVKLIVSAAVPADRLYTRGPLAHEFVRTVSRLNEMQTEAWMRQGRREVDTRLTIGPVDV